MPDRGKVIIKAWEHLDAIMGVAKHLNYPDYGVVQEHCLAILALLKEQEAEKEALASLASLADHRRERVGKVLYDLCELGYPHNFQHEAPWVVDYLYKLTAIIKRAYEVKNNDNT